jgi:hypothetical protein
MGQRGSSVGGAGGEPLVGGYLGLPTHHPSLFLQMYLCKGMNHLCMAYICFCDVFLMRSNI